MAFSLSNWFKGKSPTLGEESEMDSSTQDQTHPSAPPSVRTVTPNTVQPQSAPGVQREPTARPTVTLTATKLPTSSKVTPVLPTSRRVPFAPSVAVATETAPPLMAPKPTFTPTAPDMTVSLEVGDFLDRLPATFLQTGSFDRTKKIEFQASELYSDLAKGRASVPASVIYHRCPEIFSRPVTATEDVEVQLPLQKLVEQMGTALSTRTDQVEEENVGEIETPFLQVAMEDNARVPTAAGSAAGAIRASLGLTAPVAAQPPEETAPEKNGGVVPTRPHRTGQISTISPVKATVEPSLAPPTAATASPIIAGKRPPSTVRASVAGGKIRLSGPAVVNRMSPTAPEQSTARPGTHSQRITLPVPPSAGTVASPSHQVTKKTARIQIPPISLRAGGPNATPRPSVVPPPPTGPAAPAPAPSGAGVPSFRPSVGKEGAPTISFRTSPPPPSAKPLPPSFAPPRAPAFPPPSFPAVVPAMPAPVAVAPVVDDRKIELGLAAILRSLPSSMLTIEPSTVPHEVRISLPFALVEPQLSQGRVAVGREIFIQALPESHRQVLSDDPEPADIPLPLQEVFQNLPASALSIRGDQVAEETGAHYPTPFSQKADEDAQRLSSPMVVPAPTPAAESKAASPEIEAVAVPEAASAAPEVEAITPAPEKHEAPEKDTVADLPPIDVELPVNSTTEPIRDIPIDLGASPAVQDVSPAPEVTPEKSSEVPVEVRDIPLGDDVHPEEGPAAEAPSTAPAIKLPELPSAAMALVKPEAVAPQPAESLPTEVPEAITQSPIIDTPGVSNQPSFTDAAKAVVESPVVEVPEAITQTPVAEAAKPPMPETPHAVAPVETPTTGSSEPASAPAMPVPAAAIDRPVSVQDSVLQILFMTEEDMDAKTIVKLVCQLPSVDGCAVMFEDGLRLAGNFPSGNTEGFSAMAAPFYKRAVRFVSELELGGLQAFTLHTENGLLSFFMHDNICVSVHHAGRGFMPGVREKLEIVTRELARMYATAKPVPDAE